MKYQDKIAEIMKQRESIIEAFIAETGLKPSEIEQVEERTENGIRWYLQKHQESREKREHIENIIIVFPDGKLMSTKVRKDDDGNINPKDIKFLKETIEKIEEIL